jgi:hypothetical protein
MVREPLQEYFVKDVDIGTYIDRKLRQIAAMVAEDGNGGDADTTGIGEGVPRGA